VIFGLGSEDDPITRHYHFSEFSHGPPSRTHGNVFFCQSFLCAVVVTLMYGSDAWMTPATNTQPPPLHFERLVEDHSVIISCVCTETRGLFRARRQLLGARQKQ
jgi:hypothetical protein